ncbi:signal peptidase complex subunit spc2 [Vermiconidia calcicola]|uniref:Signal peptidase complex subunit spc2 n=1 Tax=Vermiconidia calcicola TaxID=1690605 RepID=A0ACC3NXE0_9PEZI|nr:signal peptidase complex subunit spc2 [Vermiconidia calcicola]
MSDSHISPYSLNDLKNTTDDALGNYLRGLHFKQDNSKLDFRLAIGYTAVAIAAVTFVADYKLGWDATKNGTAVAVAAYAVLNGIFTYWMYFVEKGLIFEGSREGRKISLASRTKKHTPTYFLTVTSALDKSRELDCPFTTWFTEDGYFVAKPFQQWLASTVDVIGEADVKSAVKDETDSSQVPEVESNGTPSASGADARSKGTKRSKRKG